VQRQPFGIAMTLRVDLVAKSGNMAANVDQRTHHQRRNGIQRNDRSMVKRRKNGERAIAKFVERSDEKIEENNGIRWLCRF